MQHTLSQERRATEIPEDAPTAGVTRRFKTVQFHAKVITKTSYKKLKSTLQEIDVANEKESPLRDSDFAIKRREQKLMMKLHHQHRPLTPRRIPIVKHIRETLQRKHGNLDSFTPKEWTIVPGIHSATGYIGNGSSPSSAARKVLSRSKNVSR